MPRSIGVGLGAGPGSTGGRGRLAALLEPRSLVNPPPGGGRAPLPPVPGRPARPGRPDRAGRAQRRPGGPAHRGGRRRHPGRGHPRQLRRRPATPPGAPPLAERLAAAYAELAGRLGPRVVVAAMAGPGVELALGVVADPQFGPLVMVAAGGVLVEVLRDRRFAIPPVDHARALAMLDRLAVRPLLDGVRGAPPVDRDAVADAVVRRSALADALAVATSAGGFVGR